jgi:hypothetical protein
MTNEGEGEALGEGELCHSISTKYWVLSTASGLLLVKVSCARSMELKDKKVFAVSKEFGHLFRVFVNAHHTVISNSN